MTPVALFGIMGVQSMASPMLIVVENRSTTPLTVSFGLNYGKPYWQGVLQPGATARGAGKIRGDGQTVLTCTPPNGATTFSGFGYVTHGFDERVTLVIRSCTDVLYDQQDLML